MVVDQSTTTPRNDGPAPAPRRAKYRLRFRKTDNLRLVSHHDLMHVFERMLRRAELPLCTTHGFHPQPRMIFAQSLALGIAGCNEVVELELKETFSADEVQTRLARQTPPGMEILSTREIDFKAGAQVRRAFYRLDLPLSAKPQAVEHCAALNASTEIWVERTRPRPRRFNLRPFINRLEIADRRAEPGLEVAFWVTPNGTGRPDEVAQLLGLTSLLDEGAYFERTFLELYDEVPRDDAEIVPPCLLERVSTEPEREHEPASSGPHAEPALSI